MQYIADLYTKQLCTLQPLILQVLQVRCSDDTATPNAPAP